MSTSEIFVTVPLARCVLHDNPTPRPEAEVTELAKDIGLRGMIHPPVARVKCISIRDWQLKNYDEVSFLTDLDNGDINVEIGPGQTRFKAAEMLGWKEVTVKLVEMDDAKFMELMVSENLKRHDMHPVDVSDYFKKCVDRKEGVRKIATRHGFSEAYVKKMLKLQELGEAARDWFRKKAMTIEQAVALANTTPEFQASILEKYMSETPAGFIFLPSPVKILNDYHDSLIQIRSFDWDLEDADLLPEAGPCSICPKRSDAEGSVLKLWLGEDVMNQYRGQKCLDHACMAAKSKLHQDRLISALKSKYPNHEDVGYLASKWDLQRDSSLKHKNEIKQIGEYWDRLDAKAKPCSSLIVIGRPHPAVSERDHYAGKVYAYCSNPKCSVHPRYSGPSGRGSSEMKGLIVAEPMPSDEARRKLAKQELDATGRAIAAAMGSTLQDCLSSERRERLQGTHQAQFPEPLFWEIFKLTANKLELATDKVLRRIGVENGFDDMGKKGSSWYNGLAETIYHNKDGKAEQLRPWRDWLHEWQEWLFKAVITADKFICGEKHLSEWAKLMYGVNHQQYFEAAMADQNVKLERKRSEVLALEAKDAVLLSSIKTVLTGPQDILYQDENQELLLRAIKPESLAELDIAQLKSLIKWLGGTAKRGAETPDLQAEVTKCIGIWKTRITASEQNELIAAAKAKGHHTECPNCKADWGADEIIANTCHTCGWPEVSEEWRKEQQDEIDQVIADGGVKVCHQCKKDLSPDEILEQFCDDCNDYAAADEEDVDEEE